MSHLAGCLIVRPLHPLPWQLDRPYLLGALVVLGALLVVGDLHDDLQWTYLEGYDRSKHVNVVVSPR